MSDLIMMWKRNLLLLCQFPVPREIMREIPTSPGHVGLIKNKEKIHGSRKPSPACQGRKPLETSPLS